MGDLQCGESYFPSRPYFPAIAARRARMNADLVRSSSLRVAWHPGTMNGVRVELRFYRFPLARRRAEEGKLGAAGLEVSVFGFGCINHFAPRGSCYDIPKSCLPRRSQSCRGGHREELPYGIIIRRTIRQWFATSQPCFLVD
jgi:hypothetical protein